MKLLPRLDTLLQYEHHTFQEKIKKGNFHSSAFLSQLLCYPLIVNVQTSPEIRPRSSYTEELTDLSQMITVHLLVQRHFGGKKASASCLIGLISPSSDSVSPTGGSPFPG